MMQPDENEKELVYPICGKEFTRNDDTKYVTHGGYTCSWDCFLSAIKNREQEKNNNGKF